MSRLIDADKLRINCVCVNGICIDGRTIENAPTVKAIPIEWIWKWYDEETHRLGDGWTHVEHPYSIKRMIEDWERENEKDI